MSSGTSKQIRKRVILPWRRHRFTNEQYGWLIGSGFFSKFGLKRAFLWNGEIVESMAEDQPHLMLVFEIAAILRCLFNRTDWAISLDQPVALEDGYRPQPDVCLLRGSTRSWAQPGRVPAPEDVALLVEISRSSYHADATVKLSKYARSGIPIYWIVNVNAARVEVYTNPLAAESRYETQLIYVADQVIPITISVDDRVVAFPGIPVRELLDAILPN